MNFRANLYCLAIGVLLASLGLTENVEAQRLLNESSFTSRKNVTIKKWTYTSDGLRVKGELYLPPGASKLPLVVFNHDGINGISKEHRYSSVRLAKAGFVVFSPSYRGEDGSQGRVEIAKGEVNDVLNALKILKEHPRVDRNRIALAGASHGALISIFAATKDKDVKAVVQAYGVMDIYKWYAYLKRSGKLGQDEITRRTYGPGPKKRPQSFAIRNGLGVVDKLNCPVLALQGALDDIVPEEQAWLLKRAMKRSGKDIQVKVYPDALHGFLVYAPYISNASAAEKAQTKDAWKTMIQFLRKELS